MRQMAMYGTRQCVNGRTGPAEYAKYEQNEQAKLGCRSVLLQSLKPRLRNETHLRHDRAMPVSMEQRKRPNPLATCKKLI
jgi:viroplasmin and RNaseH domain-containing protein